MQSQRRGIWICTKRLVPKADSALTNAWIPGHTLTYAFSGANSCGSAATAGRNTNRTSATDNGTTYTYCYDSGDKLTSTNDARYFAIAYDGRYNTTTLGDESLVYDGAGNHVATTKGTTTVRYVRDGLGRIVERKVNGTTVARYSFGGGGDSPSAVLNASNTVAWARSRSNESPSNATASAQPACSSM